MAEATRTLAGDELVEAGRPVEPGQRGTLTIADRAVAKIARAAALEVDGVAPVSATTGRVSGALGRDLPRASVQLAGHRARLSLDVATLWPYPAAAVAAAVREHVAAQLARLAAVQADAVAVTIDTVVRPTTATRARVR